MHIPISIEAGSFLGATVGALGLYFGFRKKKPTETAHAKGAERGFEIRSTIERLKLAVPEISIVSTAVVSNGGHQGDVTIPKSLEVLESTDFTTWETFNMPMKMEPALLNVHAGMMRSANSGRGEYFFIPEQLQSEKTVRWYKNCEPVIEQSSVHLIGINEREGYSVVLYINYMHKFIPSPDTAKVVDMHIAALKRLYTPIKKTWWGRKNFIT